MDEGPDPVLYLISGALDIRGTAAVLRDRGRDVRHDTAVRPEAAEELAGGGRYVVVAHGTRDGEIVWYRTDAEQAARWLWVGMPNCPRGARIYVYACHAGGVLADYLEDCELFGHSDSVPMPEKGGGDVVARFLDEVDELMRTPDFDRTEWRARLGRFINELHEPAVERVVETGAGTRDVYALVQLRRSLGFVDE